MEELSAGIRDLHDRVRHLDEQLRERGETHDLHERLGAAAMEVAELTRSRIRWLWAAGMMVALLWTPATAYGAVWFHELVRNTCYPAVVLEHRHPAEQPWYCSIFPGTHHGR
jgi:hypothetical protein